jgi:tetratricopeptide (TPR) repeat protein
VPSLRNLHFTGREELLKQLEQHLLPGSQDHLTTTLRVALTQPQAIKGPGGIGKTQIALEYAYRSRDLHRYIHTFWMNAASEEALLTSFVALAELLPAFSAKREMDQSKLVEAIKHWLEQCQQRWLLIFDNADDITLVRDYLPQRGNGSILLTTRADAVGSLAISVKVETMGFIEGTHLLLRRAQRFEQASDEQIDQAGNIVVALDHFPLALDQAGAYIEETGCSFVDYLEDYQKHRQAVLARRGTQATAYPHSVATTWSLSFQKIRQANPAAAELLQLCAFLAPDRIPEELIKEGRAYWPPLLQQAAGEAFTLNQMMAELLKFSLVKRLTEARTFSLHRLVQAVQMDVLDSEARHRWGERVVQAVNTVFPKNPKDVTTWLQCLLYLDQAQACSTLIRQYALLLGEGADLLNRTGFYLDKHALYAIAEPLYQQELSIREQHTKAARSEEAVNLNNLAELYRTQGKYEKAEPLYQRALTIFEEADATHSHMASCLNNLALLYTAQEQYEKAELLYQRALVIWERQGENMQINLANCLNNLANLYYAKEKYEEAEPLYQRALTIWKKEGEAIHPDRALNLSNLAELYRVQGKYKEAEPLYLQALAIFEQALEPMHPSVAFNLNNLALLYHAQGKYKEAEPLYQRALAIFEQTLEPTHSDTAGCLSNLANLYYIQRKYREAEPLLKRALAISEQQLGVEHPYTQNLRQGYVSLLQALENVE